MYSRSIYLQHLDCLAFTHKINLHLIYLDFGSNLEHMRNLMATWLPQLPGYLLVPSTTMNG